MQPIHIQQADRAALRLGQTGVVAGPALGRPAGNRRRAAQHRSVAAGPAQHRHRAARTSHCTAYWTTGPSIWTTCSTPSASAFDYGAALFVYPMAELPVLAHPHGTLAERGPLGNRDFTGRTRVNSYRGRKDSALALYYLWLTGEVMVHHRDNFQHVYDLRRSASPRLSLTMRSRKRRRGPTSRPKPSTSSG